MEYKMRLSAEQKAILEGSKGETLAKVMETLVRYGELFGADEMVPVTSEYNHLVTSFGLKALAPVYALMDKLIEAGAVSKQKFSADPRPLDKNVPSSFLQNFVFNKFMYTKQDFYEGQLEKLGLMAPDAFTCTCYMNEVGNTPKGRYPLMVGILRRCLCKFRARRTLQQKLGYHRPHGFRSRLCSVLRFPQG